MVCYIENTSLNEVEKNHLQAQHEFFYNDLKEREGFTIGKTIDDKEVIIPNNTGISHLLEVNKDVGKVYGLTDANTQEDVKVVSINVLNLTKDYSPSVVQDYLEEIAIEGKPEYKDLATILQDYKYDTTIREVTSIDKIGEGDYFGKITPTEILIDKESIESWANANGLNSKDEYHKVVLHELVHSLSIENIKNSPKLQKELTDLMNLVEEESWNLGYTKANAFRDIYEFVAEVMTDSDLQRVMKQIPYKQENISLWNKFIEVIQLAMKKLGLVESSSLDKFLSLTNEIFELSSSKVDVQDTTIFPNC